MVNWLDPHEKCSCCGGGFWFDEMAMLYNWSRLLCRMIDCTGHVKVMAIYRVTIE
jgi:hypothetical protein